MKIRQIAALVFVLLMFSFSPARATEVTNALAGDAGDSHESSFHFDANNIDFRMTDESGIALGPGDLPYAYGSAMRIMYNGQDWITSQNLTVQECYMGGSDWGSTSFPPQGTVGIDHTQGRFKFAEPAWNYTGFLNSTIGGLSSVAPNIVTHSDGSAICVYSQNGSGNGRIYARHYLPGFGWQPEIIIDSVDTSSVTNHASHPSLAIDEQGRAICVFVQSGLTSNYRIYANVYLPGVGWQGAELIDSGNDYPANDFPKIAMSGDNAMSVFCQENSSGDELVYANAYTFGTGWYGAVTIDANPISDAADLFVVMDTSGRALSAYSRDTTPISAYQNAYTPGTGWQTPAALDSSANDTFPVDLAISDAGYALAMIVTSIPGPSVTYKYAAYAPATGWDAPADFFSTTVVSGSYGRLAMNASGRAVAVFAKEADTLMRIAVRTYAVGGSWSAETLIDDTNQDTQPFYPDVQINNSGQAVCLHLQKLSGVRQVIAQRCSQVGLTSSSWTDGVTLSQGPGTTGTLQPQLALNNNGDGFALWPQSDGTLLRVDSSRLETDIPPGAIRVQYYYATPGTPTPVPPSRNGVSITHRKLEPLKGETTGIHLELAQSGRATVRIYDLQGRQVATLQDGYLAAGRYDLAWSALNSAGNLVASGIYVILIQASDYMEKIKVAVVK